MEYTAGYMARSSALVAEASHMLLDAGGIALALVAVLVTRLTPIPRATMGYSRAEILAALCSVLLLLFLGFWVIYSAGGRLFAFITTGNAPVEINGALTAGAAGVAVFGNLLIASVLHPAASAANLNVRAALLHVIGDVLNAVAVLTSGLVLWKWPSAYVLDPLLAFGIGVWLISSSYTLGAEATIILMQMAPDSIDVDALREGIEAIRGVESITTLEVWAMTPEDIYAHCRVQHEEGREATEILQIIKEINQLLTSPPYYVRHAYAAVEM